MNSPFDRIDDEVATRELSPELALVDPDLARVARSRMPDRPGPRIPTRSVTPPLVVADASVGGARAPDGVPSAHYRRAKRWRAARALFAVLVIAIASLVIADFRLFADESGSESRPSTPTADGGSRPSARSAVKGETASRRTAPAARPQNAGKGSRSTPQRARPTRERLRTSARSTRSARPLVAPKRRLFVWLPHRRASHYRVEFHRRGKKIFQATTLKARLLLPDRWVFKGRRFQLTPGNYRWTVRPGFGSRSNARYGDPIVASRWMVPPP